MYKSNFVNLNPSLVEIKELTLQEFWLNINKVNPATRWQSLEQLQKFCYMDSSYIEIKTAMHNNKDFIMPYINLQNLTWDGQHRMVCFNELYGNMAKCPVEFLLPENLSKTIKEYQEKAKLAIENSLIRSQIAILGETIIPDIILSQTIANALKQSLPYNYYVLTQYQGYDTINQKLFFAFNQTVYIWDICQQRWDKQLLKQ